MEKSQSRHVRTITNTKKQRHIVHHNQMTTRTTEKTNSYRSYKTYDASKTSKQIELQFTNEPFSNYKRLRGDFLGSISSNIGSSPGYCSLVI
ncbi:hypothetical protein MTR_3g091865 [Medicago truncatula]|uniref:Uncharacterized protein n=1 Tax=Medicago truncatula TaxID=3880 RepID=A0A072V0Y0_MEDTR|nr:hypothetical protein MTR_3g091865 [Medicago truncatula]